MDVLITGVEVYEEKPALELVARNKMIGLIADKAYAQKSCWHCLHIWEGKPAFQ